LLSESADGVQGDTDEAYDESDVTNGQLEDTVSGGASDAPDSSIADHSQRQRRPPQCYGEWVTPVARGRGTAAFALTVAEDIVHDEPSTYREAASSPQAASWVQTMTEEMESLHKNDTWDLVLPPKGRKIVGRKWVFKLKDASPDVVALRYKARLVAKGFSQKEGIDYHDVFSPVVKHTLIQALLVLVALFNLELEQMDVKTAFLHGELEEEIFMAQPKSFMVEGKENRVCLLKKSLYGLKQSPRQWYHRFDSYVTSHGFERSSYDACVFQQVLADGSRVYLLLYVDDILIAGKSRSAIDATKAMLKSEFEMKDLGAARR